MYNNLQKGHPTFSHLSMFGRRCLWAYAPHSLLKKIEIPASFWDKGLRSLGGIKKKAVGWSGLALFTVRQSSLVAGLIVCKRKKMHMLSELKQRDPVSQSLRIPAQKVLCSKTNRIDPIFNKIALRNFALLGA